MSPGWRYHEKVISLSGSVVDSKWHEVQTLEPFQCPGHRIIRTCVWLINMICQWLTEILWSTQWNYHITLTNCCQLHRVLNHFQVTKGTKQQQRQRHRAALGQDSHSSNLPKKTGHFSAMQILWPNGDVEATISLQFQGNMSYKSIESTMFYVGICLKLCIV